MKNYTSAPLPFQGQKRRFLKEFKTALNEFSPTATYVDLFGGSGFLSHTVKQHYPNAKVIYNDFDNYTYRLDNVEKTNALISDIREIVKDIPQDKKIEENYRKQILERLEKENGFVDYITISSSICFSMSYKTSFEALEKGSLYNKVRQSDYVIEGYLDGVIRVQKDYRDLFAEYRNYTNVVFLVDPPYLSTDTTTYNHENYWKLSDYLNVLKTIEGANYFYFTSDKSQIIELCEWMETNSYCRNPFEDSRTVIIGTQLSKMARYNDIMIYKNNE